MHGGWHCWHRPSRLIWFIIGAASATWYMKNRENIEHYRVRHCSRSQIPREAYPPPQASQAQNTDQWQQWQKTLKDKYPFGWPPQEQQHQQVAEGAQSPPVPQSLKTVAEQTPAGAFDGWEEERLRLQKIKQQAADSLLNFSEDGLDTLLSSVESLKAKLAERRAEREKEAEEQAQRESEYRQFEEWKKAQAEQGSRPPTPKRLV